MVLPNSGWIAVKENRDNIRYICDMLLGIIDVLAMIMIVLPIYPNRIDGVYYAVSLPDYVQAGRLKCMLYWAVFILLVIIGAVLFEGNIGFYSHSGFDYASKFGIRYHDLPKDADSSFFLCRELIPGYLDDVTGVYQTPQGYYVKDEDVEEFDKQFPPKEKKKLPGQLFD